MGCCFDKDTQLLSKFELDNQRFDELFKLYIHLKKFYPFHSGIIQQLLTSINIFTQDCDMYEFHGSQYDSVPLSYDDYDGEANKYTLEMVTKIYTWYASYSEDFQKSHRRFLNRLLFTEAKKYY